MFGASGHNGAAALNLTSTSTSRHQPRGTFGAPSYASVQPVVNPFLAAAKEFSAGKEKEGGSGLAIKGAGGEGKKSSPFDSVRGAPKGPRSRGRGRGRGAGFQGRTSQESYQQSLGEAGRHEQNSTKGERGDRKRTSSPDESRNQGAWKHQKSGDEEGGYSSSNKRGRGGAREARGRGRGADRGRGRGRGISSDLQQRTASPAPEISISGTNPELSDFDLFQTLDSAAVEAPYENNQSTPPPSFDSLPTQGSGLLDREFIYDWAKQLASSQHIEVTGFQATEIVDALEDRFENDGLAHVPVHTIFTDLANSAYLLQAISTAILAATSGEPVKEFLSAYLDNEPNEIRYPGFLDDDWITKWIRRLYEKRNIGVSGTRLRELINDIAEDFEDQGYFKSPLNDLLQDEGAVRSICAIFNKKFLGLNKPEFWQVVDLVYRVESREAVSQDGESQPVTITSGKGKERAQEDTQPTQLSPNKPLEMAPTSSTVSTPFLGQFLTQINGFTKVQNEKSLEEYIALEPPFNSSYQNIIDEVRAAYPKGKEDILEERCTSALTVARDGIDGSANWTQFTKFMSQYLCYLRDVDADPSKYLQTYELLYELQKRANSALVHPTLGGLVLPIVISCARLICRLAIGLDKQPELIAHVRAADSEEGPRQTLPERAAELLRGGLVTCLNDRYSEPDGFGRPGGKKRGIYKIANICLKIFFQCRKTRNAEMIFTNIGNLSPPLSGYPKRERVTYLYYLGRFWFQNSHFYRARLALEAAYDESPANMECVRQRRHILIYLMASNIIMGRFPMPALFQRPEAQGLYERFMPLMQAIRSGNLALFKQHLDLDGPHANWFLHFRILLQLRNRCEVLVWRSLVRKAYMLFGTPYNPEEKSTAPLIDLEGLTALFQALERQSLKPAYVSYIDPDLDGASDADDEEREKDQSLLPSTSSIESILSSLVEQGFLTGFISHARLKFVIQGAKQAGGNVLAAGFPQPWAAIERRASGEKASQVPGWKLGPARGLSEGSNGGGMVVNLSGARPVGAA